MASVVACGIYLLIAAAKKSKAACIPQERTNGLCIELDIPVYASAPTAKYDIPNVTNDIEATQWAVYTDRRTTLPGPLRVLQNTTTAGVWNIHAQLCVPKSTATTGAKKDVLQIASHGLHYDSRYWDPELQRDSLSYVEASLRAGYPILTYDRLGVGRSSIPDATQVQASVELEILRQLTLSARNGTLYKLAATAAGSNTAYGLSEKQPPSKIVHVGHSFGSVLTSAFIAIYGDLSSAAIITGFLPNQWLAHAGTVAFHVQYAATSLFPKYIRPPNYLVSQTSGIQTIFFGGTSFTPEMLAYGDSIKQPFSTTELLSSYTLFQFDGETNKKFKGPIQYMLPEFDFYICQGDCKGLFNRTQLMGTYPNATDIQLTMQPNTGHALTLHNNATAGFQTTFDFLAGHGF